MATPQGYPPILRHHQLQNRLLQVWPVVFGIVVGDAQSLLVALGDVVATEGKAGGVEMMEALRNTFLGTDGQRQFAEQQVTAIRMDLIERTAQFKTIEHLRFDPCTKEQIERFVG